MSRKLKREAGMTLIEILIALLITGILTAAMFRIYMNQHESWMIQDSIIEMQQNARAAIDELTRQMRMIGYALPNGMQPFVAYNSDPDSILIYYKQDAAADAQVEHTMGFPTSDIRCDGHDLSGFSMGQRAYIYDPNLESGEFFLISGIQTGTSIIQHASSPLSRAYPAGSQVMAIDQLKYYLDKSDTLHPMLMVRMGTGAPQVYAEDVTDLQISYTMKNGVTVDTPPLISDVRKISLIVTARTSQPNLEFTENPYRYETYQSSVYLRNLGT